ncbi:MAG: hypothetical protein ACI83P_000478 [Janthinobacterium sp.]|jgi:hypothetical protein
MTKTDKIVNQASEDGGTTIRASRRAQARAVRAPNPYLDGELYARMRDYTEREAGIAKEFRAIAERGAGSKSADPRFAPSIHAISAIVKKGLPLSEILVRIAAGTEKGLWEPWLTAFGFELRAVNYGLDGPRNACLALDLSVGSKANAVFAKVNVANWRSLAAEDCAELHIDKATGKAHAIFFLDPVVATVKKTTQPK